MDRCCCALDEAALERLAAAITQHDIEALAISFLHSYINPAHEERAREVISRVLPDLAITHFVGSMPRDPRIRADLDRGGQRLCAADDGSLSRAHAGWIAPHRCDLSIAADDVLGRHLHGGDGAALSGAAGGERTGGRRHSGAPCCGSRRLRSGDFVRHGRHDREDHADRRLSRRSSHGISKLRVPIASPRAAAFRCAFR